jgi:hypothetical protein
MHRVVFQKRLEAHLLLAVLARGGKDARGESLNFRYAVASVRDYIDEVLDSILAEGMVDTKGASKARAMLCTPLRHLVLDSSSSSSSSSSVFVTETRQAVDSLVVSAAATGRVTDAELGDAARGVQESAAEHLFRTLASVAQRPNRPEHRSFCPTAGYGESALGLVLPFAEAVAKQ